MNALDDLAATEQLISEPARLASSRALADLLDRVAGGEFPPADGSVEVMAQPAERDAGVLALTAFAVVFADTDPDWIAAQLPADDLAAPLSTTFLHALSQRLDRQAGSIDMLTCASPLPGAPPRELMLVEIDLAQPWLEQPGLAQPGLARSGLPQGALPAGGHAPIDRTATAPTPSGPTATAPTPTAPTPTAQRARIARALRHRDDVRAWQTAGGVIVLGRGVAGRREAAIEVDPQYRGAGLGRQLAAAARHLVPEGETVWAQIAPGNAASVRAFLRAGFRPVGAEVLLTPADSHAEAGPGQR